MTSQNDITQVKIGDDIIKHIPVMLRIPVSSDHPQKIISYTCSHTGYMCNRSVWDTAKTAAADWMKMMLYIFVICKKGRMNEKNQSFKCF